VAELKILPPPYPHETERGVDGDLPRQDPLQRSLLNTQDEPKDLYCVPPKLKIYKTGHSFVL